ncbi:hypothetical protein QQ045_030873 [Rhodiola kirilowii]
MNDAQLIKQAARILSSPNLLISKVYKIKYFPHSDLLSAALGTRPFWAWMSIFNVLHLLNNWFMPSFSAEGLSWNKKEGKELTVRSAYKFLTDLQGQNTRSIIGETSDNINLRSFWHKLWSVKAQGKVKIFIWRLFNNALPSAINLVRRGCEVDSKCVRCGYK